MVKKRLSGWKWLIVAIAGILLTATFFAYSWDFIREWKFFIFWGALIVLVICSLLFTGFRWRKVFKGMSRRLK